MTITVKNRKAKSAVLSFSHDDLRKYESLKKFAGLYGFVVPTQ